MGPHTFHEVTDADRSARAGGGWQGPGRTVHLWGTKGRAGRDTRKGYVPVTHRP